MMPSFAASSLLSIAALAFILEIVFVVLLGFHLINVPSMVAISFILDMGAINCFCVYLVGKFYLSRE